MERAIDSDPNKPVESDFTLDNLVSLLRRRALDQADQLAYSFLLDGEAEESNLTYGELDRRARSIAASLQEVGASGERVLLLYPPGLDYVAGFFGCLYARAVAVPLYPPRQNQNLHRFKSVLSDAKVKVALTVSQILPRLESSPVQAALPEPLQWVATDEINSASAGRWREPHVTGDTMAFIQYTSGSTAEPKGVMVTHGNLMHNEEIIKSAFKQDESSVIVGWLPFYHDMGLIGNIIQPLYIGARCVLMSPVAFLQRPYRWLKAISRYRATTSGGPNFAYDICVRKINVDQQQPLDLSSWSVAFNGSEPIRAESMRQFSSAFESWGFDREAFHPCYGLAEATLMVSGARRAMFPITRQVEVSGLEQGLTSDSPETCPRVKPLVSSGRVLPGQEVIIVNPESLTERMPGQAGEIWVRGPSVAKGYWNKAEETERTFLARLSDSGEGPFLRTGDLGFMEDGELFVTGRIKELIIIRGINHYPQDIELTAEASHQAFRRGCSAAFSVEAGGEERLVIVQEVEHGKRHNLDTAIEAIRQSVASHHDVQVHAIVIIKANSLPKTSSGKIQRLACRSQFLARQLNVLAEWEGGISSDSEIIEQISTNVLQSVEAIEAHLSSLLAARLRVDATSVNVNRPIVSYGLDSLTAVEIAHSVEAGLGVVVPMFRLLEGASVSELAGEISAQLNSPAETAAITQAKEHVTEYQLSRGQQSLWFMHQLAPDSPAYNIAVAARIEGDLNIRALRHTFETLLNRHPLLRTGFEATEEGPLQRIHNHVEMPFKEENVFDLDDATLNERLAVESVRPFDLEKPPLLRAALFHRSTHEHILLLTVHHIVSDFWSLAVLIQEMRASYSAEESDAQAALPPLALRYTDYVRWQEQMLAGAEGEQLRSYWRARLSGEIPEMSLPNDRPRPLAQTYRGNSLPIRINARLNEGIKALCEAQATTLFTTLLGAFQAMLHRYTGQDDIWVVSPIVGRRSAGLAGIVGYFVNPLVMRADFSADPEFADFLRQARQTSLDAFKHQDYPFALLVEQLQPARNPGMAPLSQVAFSLQSSPFLNEPELASFALGEAGSSMEFGKLRLEPFAFKQQSTPFDLVLTMAEIQGELHGSLQYSTDLFDADSVSRMALHFQTLLESIVAGPRQRVGSLSILTDSEKRQLLTGWNNIRVDYEQNRYVHDLFEAQAGLTPEAVALVSDGERLSYRELSTRANQLAHYLKRFGIGPESLVGICLERSSDLVVGLFGILKAGGAYVPLDPAYPPDMLSFMLKDSRARVLLTERRLMANLDAYDGPVICMDTERDSIGHASVDSPAGEVMRDNLAYVIYTSGTTGKPKGVQITHGGLLNLVRWHQRVYQVTAADRATQLAGIGFDASVWELWPYLTAGASVYLPDEETRTSPAGLRDWLMANKITISFLPTPLAESVLTLEWLKPIALNRLLTGGDRLRHSPRPGLGFEVVNHYGPTEATVVATAGTVLAGEDRAPHIGHPIANTDVYLLDRRLNLVPIGVIGQLYIASPGLSRGYLNQPELTAENFIPNPFGNEEGARLYKTGDLGRYMSDGNIEFLGRLDYQVKIRSHRIEPGEIEVTLRQHEGVREAFVGDFTSTDQERRLVAYVVCTLENAPSVGDLRDYLKEKLPLHMVPSAFVILENFPLTPNGKIDRRALPAPELSRSASREAFMPAQNPTEETLIKIWETILGVREISIYDNFFDLGGHSLLATQLVSKLRKSFGVEISLRSVLESPTVSEQAQVIAKAKGDAAVPRPPVIARRSRAVHLAEKSPQGELTVSEALKGLLS